MNQKLPQHVAIVMDGNGRWAKALGLPRIAGHRAGVDAVKNIVKHCLQKNISTLSLFAFSRENWSRPVQEVDFLMNLFVESLEGELAGLHEHAIHVRFIGDRTQLPSALQTLMDSAEAQQQGVPKLTINVAVNYGGQWDIVQATKQLAQQVLQGEISVDSIDESVFSSALSTKHLPDPDLLIRTSGEQRISNFFLWQFAYTELYFCDVNWPDFTVDEFEQALACFSARERRYGCLTPQKNKEELHV